MKANRSIKPTKTSAKRAHATSRDEHASPKRVKLESHSKNKVCKPGKRTVNPFFNFLREMRKTMCGLHASQLAIEGGKRWRSMSDSEKLRYYQDARKIPRTPMECVCPMPGQKPGVVKARPVKKAKREREIKKEKDD